jgi:hypothetical protein
MLAKFERVAALNLSKKELCGILEKYLQDRRNGPTYHRADADAKNALATISQAHGFGIWTVMHIMYRGVEKRIVGPA